MRTGSKEYILHSSSTKLWLFFSGFTLASLAIIIRLFILQISHSSTLKIRGEKNFVRTTQRSAPRGNIFDCNGRLFATNRPIIDLYWVGTGTRSLTEKQKQLLKSIERLTNKKCDPFSMITRIKQAQHHGKTIRIGTDIGYTALCQMSEQCMCPNLSFATRYQRCYPGNAAGCHLIGYVGKSDKADGQYGLEKIFDHQLTGASGFVTEKRNSVGKRLQVLEHQPATAGGDVHVTLDIELQQVAQSLFEPYQSGAFILIDPEDGAIKTMASYPDFDCNMFQSRILHETWSGLTKHNAFLNRCLKAAYPPASLFKLVTYAAGLETGVINQDSTFECIGYKQLGNRKFYCQRRWGHGTIDCQTSLAFSCNIPCYQIASMLEINDLAEYAARFGLGSKTDVILPELSGCVPTREWKQAHFNERWWQGETLCSGIGQSYLLATPLQIARMISALFTGYLVRPRIIQNTPIVREPIDVSLETRSFLTECMRLVVQRGTARTLKRLNDFTIFAKTGTAQTISMSHAQDEKNHLEHAWFASHFQYLDHKPLVMIILVEHAGSSRPAREIARTFLIEYAKLNRRRGVT